MGSTLGFSSPQEVRRALATHGFEVSEEKIINNGIKFVVVGGIIVAYYEGSGTAVFQGKHGFQAYSALRNETSGFSDDRVHSNKVLVVYTDAVRKDGCNLTALLRAGNIEPVLVSLTDTDNSSLLWTVDKHRIDLRYAVLVFRSAEFKSDQRVCEAENALVFALGGSRVVTICKGRQGPRRGIARQFPYSTNAVREVGRDVLRYMQLTGCPSLQRAIDLAVREAGPPQTAEV